MWFRELRLSCQLIAAIGFLAGPVIAQSKVEEEGTDHNPWTQYHWTAWNDVGIDAGPSKNGWEGASAAGDNSLSVTVWCSSVRDVVGYQFSYDPKLMPRDPGVTSVKVVEIPV